MRRNLALDASPPLGATLPFFINAPVFATITAGLLLYAGPSAFSTRWSPFALAATHLMTLGVFASVMMGALIQILPVVAGVQVARVRTTAAGVHALLTFGTMLLAAAFVSSENELFPPAAAMCAVAIVWFSAACSLALMRRASPGAHGIADIRRAIRLALAALLVTAGLGAALAASFAWPLPLPAVAFTKLHLTWGFGGWVGLLTAGVAYQVIPMFQVTEPYPRALTHAFAPLSFLALVLASLSSFALRAVLPVAASVADAAPFAAYVVFAVVTLALLRRRKRPAPDATTLFWQTSMSSLIAAAAARAIAEASGQPSIGVAVGVLLIVGAIGSSINGMLYKIVPFLLWYHLQASLDVRAPSVPKVKAVLPDERARAQFWAHLAAFALLLAACARPQALARPAALAFGVSSAWLGANMAHALGIYMRVRRELVGARA